jgi:HTH-type transcriptional regulator/antitoxin HigA
MNIRPIKTEADYNLALKRVEELWNAEPGSVEEDGLDVLATLVDAYEKEHFPIHPPDPGSAIEFRMEQMGLKQADLAKFLGGQNRASEIMNRKRRLTLKMIRALRRELKIPVESLIGPG